MAISFISYEDWSKYRIEERDGREVLVNQNTGEICDDRESLDNWIGWCRETSPDVFNALVEKAITVIFLHGIQGNKRTKFGGEIAIVSHPHIKFIFPQAPINRWEYDWEIPFHTFSPSKITAWYTISGKAGISRRLGEKIGKKKDSPGLTREVVLNGFNEIAKNVKYDKAGIMESFNQINQIIQREIESGTRPENIILGGFSQGGSMALASSLLLEDKIGGFISCSGFLPLWEESVEKLFKEAKVANKKTPILICNGEDDSFVSFWASRKAADLLREEGWEKVEFKGFEDRDHCFFGEEIKTFLEKYLLEEPKEEATKEEWIDKQTGWLRDIGLDKIYQLINQKRKINGKDVELFGNSFLLGNLMMRINDEDFIDRPSKGLIKRMDESSFVFIPACWGNPGFHWTLFVYDKDAETIHHYNSYESIDNLQKFLPLLEMEGTFAKKIKETKEHKTPQQENGKDCGFYVCAITEFLVRKYKSSEKMSWEINQKEAKEIKKNVLIFRKIAKEQNLSYFVELATETTQKSSDELVKVQQKIIDAQNNNNKKEAVEEQLGKSISELKSPASTSAENSEQEAWRKKDARQPKIGVSKDQPTPTNSSSIKKKPWNYIILFLLVIGSVVLVTIKPKRKKSQRVNKTQIPKV